MGGTAASWGRDTARSPEHDMPRLRGPEAGSAQVAEIPVSATGARGRLLSGGAVPVQDQRTGNVTADIRADRPGTARVRRGHAGQTATRAGHPLPGRAVPVHDQGVVVRAAVAVTGAIAATAPTSSSDAAMTVNERVASLGVRTGAATLPLIRLPVSAGRAPLIWAPPTIARSHRDSGRRWSRAGWADPSCHRLRALNLIRRLAGPGPLLCPVGAAW